jgi:hypothetical protein
MTEHLGQLARDLLAAPLAVRGGVERIGRALWLYLRLVEIANTSGHICRTLESLARDLAITPERVEDWLRRLEETGLVLVQHPAPYLVLKLRFWSDHDFESTSTAASPSGDGGYSQRVVPVGSSKLQQPHAAASKKTEDGGLGEGGRALFSEILRVLGPADEDELRKLLGQFPEPIVRRALLRVKATPPWEIRKSKAALFRYLLVQFSSEIHA